MRIPLISGLVFFFLLNIPCDAQLKNLIENGSFEYTGKDTVRDRPDESWSFTTDYETVTGHATRSRAIDGFRSYLIRAETGHGYLKSDPFEVDRRERYLLSLGVCGDGSIGTEIIWWREENDSLTILEHEYLEVASVSDDWGILQFNVTSPRRASAASVRFSVFDGQVWIDDVRFRISVF